MKRYLGLTVKQMDVLGAIAMGCDTGHHPATLALLLKRGLIVRLHDRIVGRDALGVIAVPQYEMPLIEHMMWCQWCADSTPDSDVKLENGPRQSPTIAKQSSTTDES